MSDERTLYDVIRGALPGTAKYDEWAASVMVAVSDAGFRRAPQPATGGDWLTVTVNRDDLSMLITARTAEVHPLQEFAAVDRLTKALAHPQPATAAGVSARDNVAANRDLLITLLPVLEAAGYGKATEFAKLREAAHGPALAGCSPGGGGGDGWIACSERMPEDGTNVLAWSPRHVEPLTLRWINGCWLWRFDGARMDSAVTHWRPLPPAPAQQEKP